MIPVNGATLDLLIADQGYANGAPVETTLILKNHSSAPLWLNRRMLLGSPQAPRFSREIWIDFRGPDGRNIDPRDMSRAQTATSSDYGLIGSGEELRIALNLSERFFLTLPGRYLLRANYADGNERPPTPPAGATPLRAHLQTGKLQLLIQS